MGSLGTGLVYATDMYSGSIFLLLQIWSRGCPQQPCGSLSLDLSDMHLASNGIAVRLEADVFIGEKEPKDPHGHTHAHTHRHARTHKYYTSTHAHAHGGSWPLLAS